MGVATINSSTIDTEIKDINLWKFFKNKLDIGAFLGVSGVMTLCELPYFGIEYIQEKRFGPENTSVHWGSNGDMRYRPSTTQWVLCRLEAHLAGKISDYFRGRGYIGTANSIDRMKANIRETAENYRNSIREHKWYKPVLY